MVLESPSDACRPSFRAVAGPAAEHKPRKHGVAPLETLLFTGRELGSPTLLLQILSLTLSALHRESSSECGGRSVPRLVSKRRPLH